MIKKDTGKATINLVAYFNWKTIMTFNVLMMMESLRGTAGVPILKVLKKKQEDLNNIPRVVTRYFGGTKLGAGWTYSCLRKVSQPGFLEEIVLFQKIYNSNFCDS